MPLSDPPSSRAAVGPGYFATTHWSVVLAAGHSSSPDSAAALAALCETYWYPLYAYVRRQGYSAHDAEDLTQEFFSRILSRHYLQSIQEPRGKFRYFLLTVLKHFLADEWDRVRALKRGGGQSPIAFDGQSADERYRLEPRHDLSPEKLFEYRWALALLDQVLERLKAEMQISGKSIFFQELQPLITGDRGELSYAALAAKLGTTEGGVKMTVLRMRERYRELLRAEIASTTRTRDQVDEELRCLAEALRA